MGTGRTGMFFSVLAIAAGAVMYWAVTSQGHGFQLSMAGVIRMVVGAVGLVASGIVFAMSCRPVGSGTRIFDHEAVDAQGHSTQVHEEVHS